MWPGRYGTEKKSRTAIFCPICRVPTGKKILRDVQKVLTYFAGDMLLKKRNKSKKLEEIYSEEKKYNRKERKIIQKNFEKE